MRKGISIDIEVTLQKIYMGNKIITNPKKRYKTLDDYILEFAKNNRIDSTGIRTSVNIQEISIHEIMKK